jgi:hypothetical protein
MSVTRAPPTVCVCLGFFRERFKQIRVTASTNKIPNPNGLRYRPSVPPSSIPRPRILAGNTLPAPRLHPGREVGTPYGWSETRRRRREIEIRRNQGRETQQPRVPTPYESRCGPAVTMKRPQPTPSEPRGRHLRRFGAGFWFLYSYATSVKRFATVGPYGNFI